MTSLVGRVEDFVVEDGEVQGETQTDGVSRSEFGPSDLSGSLVSFERFVGRGFALVSQSELGKVAVIVTFPVRTSASAIRSQYRVDDTYILW